MSHGHFPASFMRLLFVRLAMWVTFCSFAFSGYSQSPREPHPAPTPVHAAALAHAIDRLKQEFAAAPRRLHRHIKGNWSVLRYTLKKRKSVATPLVAVVIVDYNPLSILKYNPSYRYQLTLELRHDVWAACQLTNAALFGGAAASFRNVRLSPDVTGFTRSPGV
jgi:hypothetical protein